MRLRRLDAPCLATPSIAAASTLRFVIMSQDPLPTDEVTPDTASIPVIVVKPPPSAPDHRDMYILILGLVVGLALSPWIMGRFMGEVAYNHWYYGGGQAVDDYQAFLKTQGTELKTKDEELLDRLVATGVTKEAVDEMRESLFAQAEEARKPFTEAIALNRQAHEQWVRGMMVALILLVVAMMFAEPLFEMTGPLAAVRRRLVTGRYAALAVWIAFALAKPHAIQGIPWIFVLLALVVVLAATVGPAMIAKPKSIET